MRACACVYVSACARVLCATHTEPSGRVACGMRLEAQVSRPHSLTDAQFDSITTVSSQLCRWRRDPGGARPWLAAEDDMLTLEPSRAAACTFSGECVRARAPRSQLRPHRHTIEGARSAALYCGLVGPICRVFACWKRASAQGHLRPPSGTSTPTLFQTRAICVDARSPPPPPSFSSRRARGTKVRGRGGGLVGSDHALSARRRKADRPRRLGRGRSGGGRRGAGGPRAG